MNKYIYTRGLLGALLCSSFIHAKSNSCNIIEVTASSLNVRTGHATKYAKVGAIERSERYAATKSYSRWKEIWYDNRKRWVYAKGFTKATTLPCVTVNASKLNVRSGPSSNYRSIGFIPRGSKWYPLERSGSWQKIWYKSEKRWVHSKYLNTSSTLPTHMNGISINKNASKTSSRFVTITADASSDAKSYQISENSKFSKAVWKPFAKKIRFTLSSSTGKKRLYFRIKNTQGRLSNTVYDDIVLQSKSNKTNHSINHSKFHAQYRKTFGKLSRSQLNGLNFLLNNIEKDKESNAGNTSVWRRENAYILATIKHEVANKYVPITEYSKTTCRRYNGGCTYKGRGYVQLTHKYNYRKLSSVVGVDLVANPRKALDPDISYHIASYGMYHGIFTGRKLGRYISVGKTDYLNARRVINGKDRASLIARYARKFESILKSSVKEVI